jgi:uncharacterized protein YlxW (UPF0749 family)
MKNTEATLFVFIACIILGILITSNLNYKGKSMNVFLNSKQYQEQYNYRNNLTTQVDELRNKNMDLSSKLQELKDNNDINNETNVLQDELNTIKTVSGETNVVGPGIIITLDDGTDKFEGKVIKSDEDLSGLIHSCDISYIINDLMSAGAEAVSLNDQRIVNTTEIYCTGPFIRINGVTVATPFIIKAIGNKDKLKDYVTADTNYLYMLIKYRGIQGTVVKNDNIEINAYNDSIKHGYLKAEN